MRAATSGWTPEAVDLDALPVLGIETSCDETAAAVVVGGRRVRSSVVSSQVDLPARYGGAVPEVANRAHVELLTPVIAEALVEAGLADREVGAVAATYGPGLVGALLVGVATAKALALVWDVPFVAVNDLEARLHAALLDDPDVELPVVVLLASGGHTLIVAMDSPGVHRVLAGTVDDAAGEAFDKVARALGLAHPGGPAIDKVALDGDPGAVTLPRGPLDGDLALSFSGLKTAVIDHVRRHPDAAVADVAASFQAAVVDVLVTEALRAAARSGAKGLCLGGGVAANSLLRAEAVRRGEAAGLRVSLPSPALCADNAAMVAAAGWHRLVADGPSPLDTGVVPGLSL